MTSVIWRQPGVQKRLVTPLLWISFSAITSLFSLQIEKNSGMFGISEFFGVRIYANFQFSRGHVTTFRHTKGAYICQMPGHRLAKRSPSVSRLSTGTIGLWKTVSCRLCALRRIVEGTLKTKMFFGSGSAHYIKNCGFFKTAPVLNTTLTACRRNRGDPLSLYRN